MKTEVNNEAETRHRIILKRGNVKQGSEQGGLDRSRAASGADLIGSRGSVQTPRVAGLHRTEGVLLPRDLVLHK